MKISPALYEKFLRPAGFLLGMAVALPLMADSPHSLLKGTDLPAPPQQGQPWTPPKTTIPAPVVDAFVKLFDQGLPDPRGCDYREVKALAGAEASGNAVVKLHGWVYPRKGDARFVIGWDGLVYPVVSVLGPADLGADVSAMIDADKTMWQRQKKWHDAQPQPIPWMPERWDASEYAILDAQRQTGLPPLHANDVALLLMLGENDLAAKAWTQWCFAPAEANRQSPYAGYALPWIMRQEAQMSDAYVRQDDRLALALARRFAPIRKAFDAEMVAHPAEGGRRVPADAGEFSREFLAELERRVAGPSYTPLLDSDSDHVSGQVRIKLLIRDLEEVNAFAFSDGGASISQDDPVIAALIKEGDAAVGPLLECYEQDTRKTRAISDNQGGVEGVEIPERTFIGVDDAAYCALTAILKQSFYDQYKEADLSKAEIAGRIHAYLKQYAGLSQPEIWYRILTDDKTASGQWLDAMEKVTFPADLADDYEPGMPGGGVWKPRLPGENPALMGEPLRNKTSPSVTDLLLGKMRALEKKLDGTLDADRWHDTLGSYDRVTRSLAAWDGRNHLDELRKVSEIAHQNSMQINFRMWLFDKRDELGDPRAMEEYAAWLADIGIQEYHPDDMQKIFQVAWEHPASPAIQKTIAAMFADNGAWAHSWKPSQDYFHILINSPLSGIAGFRQELLRGLADKGSAGEVTVNDGKASIGPVGWSQYDINKSDPLLPAGGVAVPYRVCDIYAFYLRDLPAAPHCELYWPEARRDEAAAAAAQYLHDYGDLLQYAPGQGIDDPGGARAQIHFPKLGRPATEDDVKQHRAIFTLGDGSRVWALPQTPAKVFWMAKKDAAHPGGLYGLVWQAEENLVDGKWMRWFGFVGERGIERIPGSELEFILPDSLSAGMWAGQPGGINTLLGDPDGAWPLYVYTPSGYRKIASLPAGRPLRARFSIRNRTGADMTFPPDFFQRQDGAKQLPPGVKLSLFCCEIAPGSPGPDENTDMEKLPWKEVPLRDGIPAAVAGDMPAAPVVLGSAEKKIVFNIDLGDFFDLSKRGLYRLKVVCANPASGMKIGDQSVFIIGGPSRQ